MLSISIPGFADLTLAHLVSDYNGTLALDGKLLPGVAEAITAVAGQLRVHVITADTFGLARAALAGLPVELHVLPVQGQAEAKARWVQDLGTESVVALGNGRNDRLMLKLAALGIALIQHEGGAVETAASADLLSTSVTDALNLLLHPNRLIAGLRS